MPTILVALGISRDRTPSAMRDGRGCPPRFLASTGRFLRELARAGATANAFFYHFNQNPML